MAELDWDEAIEITDEALEVIKIETAKRKESGFEINDTAFENDDMHRRSLVRD